MINMRVIVTDLSGNEIMKHLAYVDDNEYAVCWFNGGTSFTTRTTRVWKTWRYATRDEITAAHQEALDEIQKLKSKG